MISPRSSLPAAKGATKPKGYGVAIPDNPQELLKLIQRQHKKKLNNVNKQADFIGRAEKQEKQREIFENKLMEFEDYIYKAEGADRLNRHFEILRMETEDELSGQVRENERSKTANALKDKLREEVEARKEEERLAREAKKKAAEARRQAVVERLRKKAEEEERRRLEAEAALKRIEEAKERQLQWEKDRLLSDLSAMPFEDELSTMVEMEYRERMERELEVRKEQEKLAEWERMQQAKDAEEKEKRKARMAALEEKKAKLAELKRIQQQSGGVSGSNELQRNMNNTRDEAAKLNKQMRIQNRAKFVTKKIQKGEAVPPAAATASAGSGVTAAAGGELVGSTAPLEPPPSAAAAAAAQVSNATPADAVVGSAEATSSADMDRTNAATVVSGSAARAAATQPSSVAVPQYQTDFLAEIEQIDSEVDLKALQKKLMAEKRGLRLEQRQRLAQQQQGGGGQHAADVEHAKELRQQIEEVTFKESSVQKRLGQLLAAQNMATTAKASVRMSAAAGSEGSAVPTNPALQSASEIGVPAPEKENAPLAPTATTAAEGTIQQAINPAAATSTTTSSSDTKVSFQKADQVLRECQHLLSWIEEKNSPDLCDSGDAPAPAIASFKNRSFKNKSFAKSIVFTVSDDASMMRRITVLLMEIPSIVKDIDPNLDMSNYAEKLSKIAQALKEQLEKSSAETSSGTGGSKQAEKALIIDKKPSIQQSKSVDGSSQDTLSTSSPAETLAPGRKDAVILTSASTSQLPVVTGSTSSSAAKIDESTEITQTGKGTGSSALIEEDEVDEQLQSGMEEEKLGDLEEQEEEEGGGDGGEGEEEGGFENIPGWEECLTTSMASAAHHAAFYGYAEVLDCLCMYFDCFVMDKKGRTPLFYAALQNQLNCVASLVALDSQWLDVGDENGDTPLHAAAIANGVDCLGFLLSCEANPDTANYAGLTPCHLARSRDALSVLYEAGAQPYCVDGKSHMPIWFASSEGRSDCVDYLCSVTPAAYLLWPDSDGETILHKAAMNGHTECVEVLCQWLQGVEDLYTVNKKQHTAAHVASNANVLKALYENGANLWITDAKGRMPLFTASFLGRAECVAFLLDVAVSATSSASTKSNRASRPPSGGGGSSSSSRSQNNSASASSPSSSAEYPASINHQDKQGDSALHAACLCGHIQCVSLLLYYSRSSTTNKQGLTPAQLASRAGHDRIAQLVGHVEQQREQQGLPVQEVFGCEFGILAAVTLYYGSRWTKAYDVNFDSVYYVDRVTGESQWERPPEYDEPQKDEAAADKARSILFKFYSTYNPDKLYAMNEIVVAYRNRYTDLFISLADKYKVQDLSLFEGVHLD